MSTLRKAFLVSLVLMLAACSSPEKKAARYTGKGQEYMKASKYTDAAVELRTP